MIDKKNIRHEMRFIFPLNQDREAIKKWIHKKSIIRKYVVFIDDYFDYLERRWMGDVYLGKKWFKQKDRSITMINFREELNGEMYDRQD